jgi:hypothetical protein
LFEGFSPSLDGFDHGPFTDLVAQAGRFEIVDDGLFSGFSF